MPEILLRAGFQYSISGSANTDKYAGNLLHRPDSIPSLYAYLTDSTQEEGFMTVHNIRRLVSLHEKAERHENEYRKLLMEPSARSKALWHKRKSEQLYSQVSGLIRATSATK
jgi:hypothetical protein